MSSEPQPRPPKGRLISHFENRTITDHGRGWSDLWDSGDSDLWDRGMPSPALIDLIEEYSDTLFYPFHARNPEPSDPGTGAGQGERKKALVPGCGRGYDVVTLALHGFDAYGLEISSTAVSEAEKFARSELDSPRPHNFGQSRRLQDTNPSPGTMRFTQGDFFEKEWVESFTGSGKFDLVYDYTFLCALHPSLRPRWAERMAELIKPGGLLVCLEFPMYKDPELPGPPWGVNGVHLELLGGEGGRFRRVVYLKPERTFEVGKGTDWISVYERV
ncbi:S-adenosyl-L-methionine-dependent methyltransferase [Aspergillus egyptiacus]|nr:S-adenosyl-L-methionine-dependent methyltransferase [Aspergillus egyptiacus]